MKKIIPYIIFFLIGVYGTVSLGEWGFFITVIIGTLFFIYQELQKITSLLRDKASKNNIA